MSEFNHVSMISFNSVVGGDILKDSQGKWYSRIHNVMYFDENGYIEMDKVLESIDPEEEEQYRDVLKEKYSEKEININNNINYERRIKKVCDRLLNHISDNYDIKIIDVIIESRIYKIDYEGRTKILKIIRKDEGSLSIYTLMKLHSDMSDMNIGPHISIMDILDYKIEYLYIIMDYIPLTLEDVKHQDRVLYDDLTKRINDILRKLTNMGWKNFDVHDENFVYDPKKDKLYMIDFTDFQKRTLK